MAVVTISNTDLAAQAREAGVILEEEKPETKPEGEAVAAETEPVKETKPEAEDTEDENGLTEDQRKELTQKMQRAIGKKHRQLKEAEELAADQYRERQLAEQRASALEREIARLKTQLEAAKPDPEAGKPKRDDFDSEEKWRDAVDDWRVEQKFKAREAERAKAEAARQQEEMLTGYHARVQAAMEIVPDFEESIGAVDEHVPPAIGGVFDEKTGELRQAGYLQQSEMNAELLYYFSKNPEFLQHLQRLPVARQLVEVGKIEATLQPFAASKPAKTNGAKPSESKADEAVNGAKPSDTGTSPSKPRAAAPIKPISSGSAVQVEKPPSERTSREETTAWQKQRGVNLERRKRH